MIEGNIAYNGPRAGVNFDDGLGGGSVVTRNVLFNFCRESSDVRVLDLKRVRAVSLTPQAHWNAEQHGPFNSWDRVVYVYDGDGPVASDGSGTVMKKNDTISYNWILANYHSSMAIDNDDGSCFCECSNGLLRTPHTVSYLISFLQTTRTTTSSSRSPPALLTAATV